MTRHVFRKRALTIGASAAAISTSMLIGLQPAMAQDEPAAEEQQAIVITGSRIVRRDYAANSPLVTISDDAFENRSSPSVEEALNDLPQFATGGSAAINSGAGAAFPGADAAPGAATLNLRGLGLNRTLVLVNGRRAQPVNAQLVVDVNTIPSAAVANVEVITGGAAAVYGADAIAGVVNFKLKDDFEGLELNGQAGITEAGDGVNYQFSALAGGNFADGRGNAMFGITWSDRRRAYQRNRDFYTDGWNDPNTAGGTTMPITVASLNGVNYGVNFDGSLFQMAKANDPNAPFKGPLNSLAGGAGWKLNPKIGASNDQALGFNDPNGLVNVPLTRYTVFGASHFDLTDSITFFFEGNFSHSKAYARSLYGFFGGGIWNASVPYSSTNDDPDSPTFGSNQNNFHPVSRQLADLLNTRANKDSPWTLNRGLQFAGQLYLETYSDIFQVTTGFRGDVGISDWTWEVYGSHGNTNVLVSQPEGAVSMANIQQIINGQTKDVNQNVNGRSISINGGWSQGWSNGATFNPNTCTSGIKIFNNDGSVPQPTLANGEGVIISDDCKSYINLELTNETRLEQNIVEATMQGKLIDLWAGEARFALGATYRDANFNFLPDAGNSGEQANTSVVNQISLPKPTAGAIAVREVYGEALLPVLHDLPLIKQFDLEIGGRYSDYDRSGGVFTAKALGDWQVTDWLRLRGGFQLANRAPNIYEQFAPIAGAIGASRDACLNITGFTPTWGNRSNPDELVAALGGTASANVNPNIVNLQAACKALITRDGGYPYRTLGEDPTAVGQSPDLYPNNLDQTRLSNHRTILSYNGNFPFSVALQQGNPNLKSEKAHTITLGAVINSPFEGILRRLTFTVDYYSVDLKDTIGTPSGADIYSQCLNPENNPLIAAPAGSLTGEEMLAGSPYCALINRFPFSLDNVYGAPGGGTDRTYDAKYLNKGGTKTTGLDITGTWAIPTDMLGLGIPGTFTINGTGSILLTYREQPIAGAPWINYKGTLQNQAYNYKLSGSFGYSNSHGSIGLRVQHLPSIRAVPSSAPGVMGADAHTQFDLYYRYQLNDTFEVRGGVDNLFDTAPEVVGASSTNANLGSTSAVYDTLGRAYYIGVKMRM